MNIPLKAKQIHADTLEFELRSGDLLKRMKRSGGTVVLTRRGRAAAVALDLKSYRRMLAQVGQLEDIEAIRLGLDAARRGQTRPWEQVEAQLRKKLGLPGPRYRTSRG